MDASVKSMSGMQSAEEATAKKADILSRSIDAGKQKISLIQGEYDRAKEKLKKLEQALEDAKREFGENSEEALKAQTAYNKQAKAVNDLGTKLNNAKADVNRMTKEMEDMGDESSDASKDVDKLGDELDDVGDSAKKAGDQGTKLGTIFKGAFFANIATAALQKLKDALVGVAKGMIDAAAEYNASMAAYEQIMGDYLDTANAKLEELSKQTGLYSGLLRGDFTQSTAKFKGLGYDISDALDLAAQKTSLAADAAAFCDKSFEDASSALNSFINGSYQGGEAIQLFANDAQMAQYAVEQGIVSSTAEWSKLDEATKQATRLEYAENLYAQAGALGQAAREAGEWNAVMMNLRAVWRDFLAKIGTPLLQALTPVIQSITEKLTELINRIDWDKFTEKVSNFLNFVIDNAGAIAAACGVIAAGFLAVSIAASPITLLAVAIAACIAATVMLKKKVEELTGVDMPAWASTFLAAVAGGPTLAMAQLKAATEDEIKTAEGWRQTHFKTAQDVAQVSIETSAAMGEAFMNAGETVKGAFEGIKGVGKAMADNLKAAAKQIGDDFAGMKDRLSDSVDGLKTKFSELSANVKAKAGEIKQWFADLPSQVYQIGANIVTGLWNGIRDKFSWLVGQIKSFAHNVVDQLKGFFGIHSPSTVMRDEVGKMLMAGLAGGITAGAPMASRAMMAAMSGLTDTGITMPAQAVRTADIERVGSGIVNGVSAGGGGSMRIEVPLVINGREFARAVLSDFRAVQNASPEVAYG